MSTKNKIFVLLAIIVAAFYTLEVVLAVMNQGLVAPAFVKAGMVAVLLYYAIRQIRKAKALKTSPSEAPK